MNSRMFCTVGSLLLTLAPAAFGQKLIQPKPQIEPGRQMKFKSSPINTDMFFTRVDESFNYQPKWPENPGFRDTVQARPNGLVAGGLLSAARVLPPSLFPAIDATGWTPPDPDIAVGPNHIVATVNATIAFFDKSGNKQFQQVATTFFNGLGAGTFQFDPKCFYDRVAQRYVILYLEQSGSPQTSKLLVAVSDDNDPNGTWFRYRIEAMLNISGQNFWLDYPGFGYNKDAFVACGNMFGFTNGFGGVQFIVMPKTPMLTGAPVTVTSLRDAGGGSAQVAEMISNTATNIYALARNGTTAVRLYSINTPGGVPTINFTSITVPANNGPSVTAQSTNGRTLDTIDGRIYNVTWRGDRLVGAHNIQSGSFVGSRWYEVNTNNYPANTPSLVQSGNITNAALHYFCPALSLNAYGDISTVFTGSSTSVTANLLSTGRTSADTAGTMGAPQLLEASAGNNYSQGRWGDYFGVDVDPVDDLYFWGIGMSVAANNNWRTSIFKWRVASILKDVTFNPNPVPGGTDSLMTVNLTSPADTGGVTVSIRPLTKGLVRMPTEIFIPAGATSGTAVIRTSAVTGSVTIQASANAVSRTGVLTIN